MKNVMIVFPERKLAPKGGPAGYLYNLKSVIDKLDDPRVKISFYQNAPASIEENQSLRNKVPAWIKDIRRAKKFAGMLNRSNGVDDSLLEYDVLHFHNTEEMYFARETLEKYKGKVVLTSHTPCAPYQELIGRLTPKLYQKNKSKIDALVKMDEYAFNRADYIIFPCEEAEEPYFHTWEDYAKIRRPEKYRYVPTGIVPCSAKRTREEIRRENGIPADAFLLSYAGRHNEIKGFGDLKKIGEQLLKDKDVYFIIAGKEGPIYRLDHERWIEIGWTNDPHSLISASDVFVLPNRETYFDLILLEVISLGVPMVLSETGGNKYFKQFGSDGFMFYKTVDEAVSALRHFKQLPAEKREKCSREVKEIFEKNFTVETFAENYLNTISEIAEG